MKKMLQKGFTLIELLVVITIIGILATGAVTVYTSQMTKARDSTRLSDIKALQGAIEQAYMDDYEYPDRGTAFGTGIADYMTRLPHDPRQGGTGSGTALDYFYQSVNESGSNSDNAQRYEISVAFEGTSGVPSSVQDNGDDNNRHEVGVKNTSPSYTAISTVRSGLVPETATAGQCFNATNGAAAACSVTLATLIR